MDERGTLLRVYNEGTRPSKRLPCGSYAIDEMGSDDQSKKGQGMGQWDRVFQTEGPISEGREGKNLGEFRTLKRRPMGVKHRNKVEAMESGQGQTLLSQQRF